MTKKNYTNLGAIIAPFKNSTGGRIFINNLETSFITEGIPFKVGRRIFFAVAIVNGLIDDIYRQGQTSLLNRRCTQQVTIVTLMATVAKLNQPCYLDMHQSGSNRTNI